MAYNEFGILSISGATSITISTNYEYIELLYSSDLDMWFDL